MELDRTGGGIDGRGMKRIKCEYRVWSQAVRAMELPPTVMGKPVT